MERRSFAGLVLANPLRFIIPVILIVLVGRTFNAGAQTETNLYSFRDSPDGMRPFAGLVQGSDGNFYGTTSFGGTNGGGTVFRISPSGTETNLHSFVGSPTDGAVPYAGLVQGSDGNFYGTTPYGGVSTNCPSGCGTLFRISPSGAYTNLYSFVGYPDGSSPEAGLVQGADGNLYGTTARGGTSTNCPGNDYTPVGCGTVFRISPNGAYTNLYSFGNFLADGAIPYAGLVQGSNGNFYGTTAGGGASWDGTVFRISPSGSYTNLYSFGSSPNDGREPIAGLVRGSDGNFYGTTYGGGTGTCCGSVGGGTVFRISPSGTYTSLYSFGSSSSDGFWQTQAGLVQGSDGNFYGTTQSGVFRISSSGSETNLYSFTGLPDGLQAEAGLVQGSDGSFYGTTVLGGMNNAGNVYKLSVPLNPPANQISEIQLSGTHIVFNIPSVAGETYQLQFSSSMNPTNWINVPVSVTNSIGALLTLTNFGGATQPQGFYRFDITP